MSKLDEARKQINAIDKEMAKLFEDRMNASKLVAEAKKEQGLPLEDLKRENEVIERNSSFINDPLIREYYVNYQKEVMGISKKYQARLLNGMKVAYAGVKGAFAYEAAKKVYPSSKLVSYSTFTQAYKACEKGEVDAAILPIENSFAGDVGEVMDLIFSGSLYINQIVDLDINQSLLGIKGASIKDIKLVMSHPQALAQCGEYIENHKFEIKEVSNTALGAKLLAESNDKSIGVIGSEENADIYGLEVLESKINTARNNTTRFAVFTRTKNVDKPNNKMGDNFIIVFTVSNEAGALAKSLNIIGSHNFNMRTLRSRPMKELMWNYYFFVELEGDGYSSEANDMMNELKAFCDHLKLVGAYNTTKIK
jgi:chorismate mutase/prephenate dehydratase